LRMDKKGILEKIGASVRRKLEGKGDPACAEFPEIGPETVLLGGDLPIDSLDLAALVVELQSATGKDPFSRGIVDFRTAGELAGLFEDAGE